MRPVLLLLLLLCLVACRTPPLADRTAPTAGVTVDLATAADLATVPDLAYSFACGDLWCGAGQYCYSTAGGDSSGVICKDAPPECGPRPTCACVAPNAPSFVCMPLPGGGIWVDGCPSCD